MFILLGNTMSIVVLLDPSMKNCFNQLLVILNVSDRFVLPPDKKTNNSDFSVFI